MTDSHLLFLIPFPFNFNFLYISFSRAALPPVPFPPVALPCNRHLNLPKRLPFRPKKGCKEVVLDSLLRLLC